MMQIGILKLDGTKAQVLIGKRIITTTAKEFGILQLLMGHGGEIVSRTMLLDHIWGMGYVTSSNVIDVHIKNIRRKIRHRNSPHIETIRGAGYRIRAMGQVRKKNP